MTAIETEARIVRAAELLLDARSRRVCLGPLPEQSRPHTFHEAWEVQQRTVAALGGRGGWKVGAGAPDAEPGLAPLPARGIASSPTKLRAADFNFIGIEAEIGFKLARTLDRADRPYTRAEVLDAVASVHPIVEVVDSRFADWRARSAIEQAADLGNHGALVVGAAANVAPDLDQRTVVARVLVDGVERVAKTGGNAAVDVQRLLVWLANLAAKRGTALAAGDIVTTGSCTGLLEVIAGARVEAHLTTLGAVAITFE